MPRKQIKDRAFQEPIHQDAPGFNVNQGHKNLIEELNTEVLPSWVTDLIGPPSASPSQFQFRTSSSGNLEYYADGQWNVVQAGMGGGGTVNYTPTRKATFTVNSPYSTDCFVWVEIETGLSYGGKDFRAYQFGVQRPCFAYVVGPGSTAGKTKYRVVMEATLLAGVNNLEVRYSDPYVGYGSTIDWTLTEDIDILSGPWDMSDGFVWARPRVKPDYLPNVSSWAESESQFPTVMAGYMDHYNTSTEYVWPVQLYNPNKAAWVSPRSGFGAGLSINGDTVNNLSEWQKGAFSLRRHSYNSIVVASVTCSIRVRSTPQGNLYGIRSGYRNWGQNDTYDSFDVVGLLNNGWVVWGVYKHKNMNWNGDSRDFSSKYGLNNGAFVDMNTGYTRATWAQVLALGGIPETRLLIPLLQATISTTDEVLT